MEVLKQSEEVFIPVGEKEKLTPEDAGRQAAASGMSKKQAKAESKRYTGLGPHKFMRGYKEVMYKVRSTMSFQ